MFVQHGVLAAFWFIWSNKNLRTVYAKIQIRPVENDPSGFRNKPHWKEDQEQEDGGGFHDVCDTFISWTVCHSWYIDYVGCRWICDTFAVCRALFNWNTTNRAGGIKGGDSLSPIFRGNHFGVCALSSVCDVHFLTKQKKATVLLSLVNWYPMNARSTWWCQQN